MARNLDDDDLDRALFGGRGLRHAARDQATGFLIISTEGDTTNGDASTLRNLGAAFCRRGRRMPCVVGDVAGGLPGN
jgi:hypothetical protein